MRILEDDAGVGLDYWLRWQVPVCALIIAIPAAVCANLIKRRMKSAATEPLSFDCLWVPCWRGLNPRFLFFYRAFAFLSMAYLLARVVFQEGIFAFYFYTQWTFTLIMVYFALGTVISAQGCWMQSEKGPVDDGEKDKFLNPGPPEERMTTASGSLKKHSNMNQANAKKDTGHLGYLMGTIYHISAGACILTDIVFWCVLVPMLAGKEFEVTFVIGCIHSVNAVYLIIDSALNNLTFQWFGFNYFAWWSVLYIIFQWTLHACGFTWWPYPFLELATPWAPLWYLGLAVFHIPCYGLYVLLMNGKTLVFSRLFPNTFMRSCC